MNPNVAKVGADPLEATAIFQQLADGWLEAYQVRLRENLLFIDEARISADIGEKQQYRNILK